MSFFNNWQKLPLRYKKSPDPIGRGSERTLQFVLRLLYARYFHFKGHFRRFMVWVVCIYGFSKNGFKGHLQGFYAIIRQKTSFIKSQKDCFPPSALYSAYTSTATAGTPTKKAIASKAQCIIVIPPARFCR